MTRKRKIALSLVGLLTAGLVSTGVLFVTSNDSPPLAAASSSTALPGGTHQALVGYLKSHPSVRAEAKKIQALPPDQRSPELRSYLQQNPAVKADLARLRQP